MQLIRTPEPSSRYLSFIVVGGETYQPLSTATPALTTPNAAWELMV